MSPFSGKNSIASFANKNTRLRFVGHFQNEEWTDPEALTSDEKGPVFFQCLPVHMHWSTSFFFFLTFIEVSPGVRMLGVPWSETEMNHENSCEGKSSLAVTELCWSSHTAIKRWCYSSGMNWGTYPSRWIHHWKVFVKNRKVKIA